MKNLGEWWLRQSLKEQKGSTIKIQAPPVKQTLISGIKARDFGSSVYHDYVYCDLFFEVISSTLINSTASQVSIHRSSKMTPTRMDRTGSRIFTSPITPITQIIGATQSTGTSPSE